MSNTKKGRDFEVEVAKRFSQLGWEVSFTPVSGDEGCDLIAVIGGEKLVIQCKDWINSVGRGAVQEIYTAKGIHDAHNALVICRSYFTNQARETAQKLNVHLSSLAAIEIGGHWDRSAEGERIRQDWIEEKEREKAVEIRKKYERKKIKIDVEWDKYKIDKHQHAKIESTRKRLFIVFTVFTMIIFIFFMLSLRNFTNMSALFFVVSGIFLLFTISKFKPEPEPNLPSSAPLPAYDETHTPVNGSRTGQFQCSSCDNWNTPPHTIPGWIECLKCNKFLWVTPSLLR